jgi:DNA-binding XRE family transcriptional regulator
MTPTPFTEIHPIVGYPARAFHGPDSTTSRKDRKDDSDSVRNVRLGEHQGSARNSHHAFIGSASGRGRQHPCDIRDVGADDGEIAAVEFHLLRDERKRERLSKYAVEQRSGISQQMVGYVERGMRRPSLETALRMAEGLGVDLAKIIKEARRLAAKRKS